MQFSLLLNGPDNKKLIEASKLQDFYDDIDADDDAITMNINMMI